MIKKINSGDKCPVCKDGRIALADTFTNYVELDQEPFKNGVIEGNNQEISLNEPIHLNVLICINCQKLFSVDVDNEIFNENETSQSKD